MVFDDLPFWGKLALADFFRAEVANDQLPLANSREESHKMISLLKRAYIAGWVARTSQLRAIPSVRTDRQVCNPFTSDGPFKKGR